jgi:hypothetical protein
MAACPAQVVSAGRLARYTEVQPQDHRRYIRCRHRAWHQRCGPCGVTAPAGRRLASGCRQGRTASCYPAACCPPSQRGDRCGAAAETGGIASVRYLPGRELRLGTVTPRRARRHAPGGPSPDGPVLARPRRRLPGRTRTSAPSRPLSRVPALRYRAPLVTPLAPVAGTPHPGGMPPGVTREPARKPSPTGDHRDERGDLPDPAAAGPGVIRCAGGEPPHGERRDVGVPALMCCAGAPRGDSPRPRWHPRYRPGFRGEPASAGSLRASRSRRGAAVPCRRARRCARVLCRQPRHAGHAATERWLYRPPGVHRSAPSPAPTDHAGG